VGKWKFCFFLVKRYERIVGARKAREQSDFVEFA